MADSHNEEEVKPAAPVGDVTVRIAGKLFRCSCGCNVFRHPDGNPNLYRCNCCEATYEGE